jgi:hypothetical protein
MVPHVLSKRGCFSIPEVGALKREDAFCVGGVARENDWDLRRVDYGRDR